MASEEEVRIKIKDAERKLTELYEKSKNSMLALENKQHELEKEIEELKKTEKKLKELNKR